MIINKHTNFTITDPLEVISMPEHLKISLRKEELNNDFLFVIPETIQDNSYKTIYKLGWLKKFYSLLYPKYTNVQVYRKINDLWQIFVGVRQMERMWLKYVEMYQKKEE